MMIVWWIVGALTVLIIGLLQLLWIKRKMKVIEQNLTKDAIAEEAWTDSDAVTIIGIHYTHSSFKKLDDILSAKSSAFSDIVVFLEAPPFILLLKRRAWSSCRSVRHTAEWADSKWLALLGRETAACEWDGKKLHRYTEVEMLLERKMMLFHSKEEVELCMQQ